MAGAAVSGRKGCRSSCASLAAGRFEIDEGVAAVSVADDRDMVPSSESFRSAGGATCAAHVLVQSAAGSGAGPSGVGFGSCARQQSELRELWLLLSLLSSVSVSVVTVVLVRVVVVFAVIFTIIIFIIIVTIVVIFIIMCSVTR